MAKTNIGRRLLHTTIDELASQDPHRVWGSMQPLGSLDFQDISISTFANAINRIAHWIVATIGAPNEKSDDTPSVLAYIGPSDLRYYVMLIAAVKTGYVTLLISHQNSRAANTSLFEQTHCKTLLNGFDDVSSVALDASQDTSIHNVPKWETFWDSTPVEPFPVNASYEEMATKPILILHTSGSTGFPKPIMSTHASFAALDIRQLLPTYNSYLPEPQFRYTKAPRYLLAQPPFHASGLVNGIQDSIWLGCTIVLPPADRKLDAKLVGELIDSANVKAVGLLPHVVEDIARDEEILEKLRGLEYVTWVGGPISEQTGDLIASRTTLISIYGSTEIGITSTLINHKNPSLWSYYFFHPASNGFEFRPVDPSQPDSPDKVYELVVVRNPSLQQVVFEIFPHLQEWPTKDLFIKHPELEHHYKLVGRSDDLIVLKNATKVNPRAAELAAKRAEGVEEAMMVGNGRGKVGIIIEMAEGEEDKERMLEGVMKALEEYNATTSSYGAIGRELVRFTTKGKPFPRAGKKTLQRGMALELYREEIEEMYSKLPVATSGLEDFRIGAK